MMTTQNFIEDMIIDLDIQMSQIGLDGDEMDDVRAIFRSRLQSFARKVVEEIEELPVTKVSGQWLTRHDAVVESVLRLSGLSGSYSDRVAGEDNQHKE